MKNLYLTALLLFVLLPLEARRWTHGEIHEIITQVNNHWQANNDAEVRSFWDEAVYHTGNMEAYRLLGRQQWLDYSMRWAQHNQWMGARETDSTKWLYRNYGEDQQHVLFGDRQVCFQTYIDLYHIAQKQQPGTDHSYMLARAQEVMGYEARSAHNDYWWWADALYMVMPVMTKIYRLTGDRIFLDKLYENFCYADSIMYDAETGLYYRDGKYVYPKHTTVSGRKDFWARGDGWVLAGLAKMLQDMPQDYEHRGMFVSRFQRLAAAVKSLQQKEGYWTRSMMDPSQAPGPETSGTALFTYGILWGVNHGLLSYRQYHNTIDRAWKYLTETALQKDGSIGFVQPIGENAIPGQKINRYSQSNFGTAAFLLAACEYDRMIDQQK